MSQGQKPDPTAPMTRREWLAISLAAAVSGCGGGTGGTAGMPGTGGTGIFASGPISGFGSVIVNGVRFDDQEAGVTIEGQDSARNSLRLGMVVKLQGQRDLGGGLGIANRIDVWAIAQGPITAVAGSQFSVAGMSIQVDGGTVFDGVTAMSAITVGLRVRVWGLQASTDGSQWTATRVEVSAVPELISSGLCSMTHDGYSMNGFILATPMDYPPVGSLMRVRGTGLRDGATIAVSEVTSLELSAYAAVRAVVELSGLVTATLSPQRFMLGNVAVDARLATYQGGSPLVSGMRVTVKGVWQDSVIEATSIHMEDRKSLTVAQIDAPIEVFTSIANFVVRGQRCDGSGVAQIQGGMASDLKVGTKVQVVGIKQGEFLRLTKLEILT
jgi:Domain of unknown function (DUF5666)